MPGTAPSGGGSRISCLGDDTDPARRRRDRRDL